MAIARDKFWMFGVRPHQDDYLMGKDWHVREYCWSRITPGEAAHMLDVPNMLMVNCDGIPVPFSGDAYGYAESFCRMNKVMWGVTGSRGFRIGNEEKFICELVRRYPNITGAFMDDFLDIFEGQDNVNEKAENLLKEIRSGLDKAERPMELYSVFYMHQIDTIKTHLFDYLDGVTLWTSDSHELTMLDERLDKLDEKLPNHKKLLGIYMFDFRRGEPISLDLMEHQCEVGLRRLREGKLDGLIFEANSVMGVGFESELWLRKWVEKVKNTVIPD